MLPLLLVNKDLYRPRIIRLYRYNRKRVARGSYKGECPRCHEVKMFLPCNNI